MPNKWLIIGISGVTCGGKTTLATELNKLLPKSHVISQDDYFFAADDPRHTWIPSLNHINFDILESLDMEKMLVDIQLITKNKPKINLEQMKQKFMIEEDMSSAELQKHLAEKVHLSNINILIIEGFCLFNYRPIEVLCDLKYYFTLDREECFRRRVTRVYEPPDCEGYFEECVWPEYLKQLNDVQINVKDVKFFNETVENPLEEVLIDLLNIL